MTNSMVLNWQQIDDFKLANLNFSLNNAESHIWTCNLNLNPEQQKQALSLLSQRQLDKYKRRGNSQSYLAGKFYLYQFLSLYSGIRMADIKLAYGEHNKPYLLLENGSRSDIEFNYSDTFIKLDESSNLSVGVFVFCRNCEVGVDVEFVERETNFKQICEKRFHINEQKFVYEKAENNQEDVINKERFHTIWTRKEAYGKAIGKGINFIMKETDFSCDKDFIGMDKTQTKTDANNQPFQVATFKLDDRFIFNLNKVSMDDKKEDQFNAVTSIFFNTNFNNNFNTNEQITIKGYSR